jgi:hypothetical protein
MNTQPVALKLAEVIDTLNEADLSLPLEMLPRISTELRRLHKENAGLRLLHKECVEKQPNIYRVDVSRWQEGKDTTYDHPLYFTSKADANNYCWTINQDKTKAGTIIAESCDIGLYPSPKELLRLHEVNAELLGLVKLVHGSFGGGLVMTFAEADVDDFKNAINKAEKQNEN